MKMKPIKALLFEDNPGDARLFKEFLHEDGLTAIDIDHVELLKTGLAHLARAKPDVILLDLGLPDSQGMETFMRVFAQAPDVPIVVLTGHNDAERAVEAVRAGAQDYLVKGELCGGLLVRAIRYAIERKQAEEALRDSQAQVTGIFNSAMDAILTVDEEQKIIIFNPSAEQVFGCPASQAIGQMLDRFIPEPDREAHRALIRSFGQSNSTKRSMKTPVLALTCLRADGKTFPSEISISELEVGGRKLYTAIVRDITERKQAEAQLVERHATLNAILESSTTPVFSIDNKYCYTSFNKAHAAVMKTLYGAEIEIGQSILEYQAVSADREESHKNLDRALCGEQFIESAFSGEPGPARRYFEVAHNPICDPTGKVIGVSVFASDITERRQAEKNLQEYSTHLAADVVERTHELQEAQEQLVRQEKLAVLGQLAGGVGHELRNPLGVINNAVYYLKLVQPDANDKVRNYHGMIEQEVHTAQKIITDLLDFARVISANRQPVSLPEIVQRTLERFPALASVRVSIIIPANLPQVYADPLHMEQVLGNLVVNACQAMPEGGKLTISATLQKKLLAIVVKDTGTGITPENMQKLFEPLFTTKITGIGLGLAVSKKLAEANGGRIEVRSKAGKGSTFTLYLPVKEAL